MPAAIKLSGAVTTPSPGRGAQDIFASDRLQDSVYKHARKCEVRERVQRSVESIEDYSGGALRWNTQVEHRGALPQRLSSVACMALRTCQYGICNTKIQPYQLQ